MCGLYVLVHWWPAACWQTAAPSTRDYQTDRYRDTAKTLGFEGHIAWAEAMP